MRPVRWIGRVIGASLFKERCVRVNSAAVSPPKSTYRRCPWPVQTLVPLFPSHSLGRRKPPPATHPPDMDECARRCGRAPRGMLPQGLRMDRSASRRVRARL